MEDNGGGLGCCKAIVKRELIFLPMFGFSWWAADFICINRCAKKEMTHTHTYQLYRYHDIIYIYGMSTEN